MAVLPEKRRGIGMFVAAGARVRLLAERRKRFAERYVEPLVAEASRLGIDADELVALIRAHAWTAIGRYFTTLTAAGLTGLLAALAVVLLAGGYATIRRVTV